jgi:predicted NACHT family NTPase
LFNGSESFDEASSDLISFAVYHSVIVLSGEPGMGKSMEFKSFTKKLKQKFPTYFVLFLDLKKYYESYQSYEKSSTNFKNSQEISKFFSQHILKLNSEGFEKKILTELFDKDRVAFLFDGFDEISPHFNEFIINLLKAIKRLSKNQIWISTRPHWTNKLVQELNAIAFELKPFTFDDQV